ncbi:uncharacterized protein L203_102405 [Cryptococcus depauperatus CBS 7841]|uniref:Uncharacterized protein n=1 Tax=Cryptococcus depauperatus CBS 7841 TaxID=1295531 RepID=A0AAJ8JRQ1_9TREE
MSCLEGTHTCYTTYVLNASNYGTAYFEINSLKVYSESNSSNASLGGNTYSIHGPLGWLLASTLGISFLIGIM